MVVYVGIGARWVLKTGLGSISYHTVHDLRRELVKRITEISALPLLPEIQLHLITPRCRLWNCAPELCPVPDPYWAFFWPGGQVLTRYLLDNPSVSRNKIVLDIGSGGGASAIAALMSGAKTVVANDVDEVAISAIQMNIEINVDEFQDDLKNLHDRYHLSTADILPVSPQNAHFPTLRPLRCELAKIAGSRSAFLPPLFGDRHKSPLKIGLDVLLVGDLFYDEEIATRLFKLLHAVKIGSPKTTVLIGDPGRHFLSGDHSQGKFLHVAAQYDLPMECTEENYGFSSGYVYEFDL